jgi:hypothetical protein
VLERLTAGDMFDSLLSACTPSDEKSPRGSQPTINSPRSATTSIFTSIEETFDEIVTALAEVPTAVEETLGIFVKAVAEIPSAIEESVDEVVQNISEYSCRNRD